MASSEDFKKYIQAGQLTEALALAMSAAVKLQITTRVLEDEDMARGQESQAGDRLRTHINMVEGQITNEIGEKFTGENPYKDLKKVHMAQVKEGAKTIQNNLKSLQKLFRLLVAMRQQNLLEGTPLAELNPRVAQNISLPPAGGYGAIATTVAVIAAPPEPATPAVQYLVDPPPNDDSPQYAYTSNTPEETNLETNPEEPDDNSPMGYGLLATAAGAATVAAVAGVEAGGVAPREDAGEDKVGRSVHQESLADLEFDEEEEFDDFDDEDRTVIQPSTVAYSPSATYTSVQPIASSMAATATTSLDALGDRQDPTVEVAKDFDHEDWDDFGENLPVEEVKPMPRDVVEVMTATLEATQPESLIPNPPDKGEASTLGLTGEENELEEDWEDLELSPLSSTDLSSFADTQEAAWEDDWEEEPEKIVLPRQVPPAPPAIMGYGLHPNSPTSAEELLNHNDDQEWDEVEEEFNFTPPLPKDRPIHPNDLGDNDLSNDDEFEIIGDMADDVSSLHNSFGLTSDSMEDIFGDLDDSLLPEYDSRLSKMDDFAGFDSEEPPSSHK